MQTRLFSLVFGTVYVFIGILGFIPGLRTHPPVGAPHVDATAAYGYFLGQFPINAFHDLFHIAVGIVGIVVFARLEAARIYCRVLLLVFGTLACVGFLPTLDTLWGWLPIFGADTWLHAATAVAAGYFGFVATEPTYVEPAAAHAAHA
jgi:Domain of unknown function (DUF4383)